MLDILLPWRHDGSSVGCCLLSLAGVAFAAGCDDANDVTQPVPRAGSGGGGAGGSAGGTGGRSLGGEGGGAGGMAMDRDAGADAASPSIDCVLGTVEQYCSVQECPEFDEARTSLRNPSATAWRAQVIVQRPCTAPNGAARVSVSANYRVASLTYVYDAVTQALVGVEFVDDLGICSGAGVMFGDPGFGLVSGRYGEVSPDCGWGVTNFDVPAECGSLDAGAPEDAGPDAGPSPSECILTDP